MHRNFPTAVPVAIPVVHKMNACGRLIREVTPFGANDHIIIALFHSPIN